LQLVTSLTVDASLLRKLLRLWDEGGDHRNPFTAVLVTPLFASSSTLKLIREELKEKQGATVYFDSGGYYAQQGKIAFGELYCALRDYYRNPDNQWADWYVLPDHVPTSNDSPAVVEEKVNDTITAVRMFYAEMPSAAQQHSLPVIQGHTFEQVNRCIEAYRELGLKYIGFGSFGTSGTNDSINVADSRSATTVTHIARELGDEGVRLHTFGVSTPPVIYAFQRLGIYSFDSLAWQRSAGYGKVYMPFTRAYNVSHRSTRNTALSQVEFELIKEHTGHRCPFCEDFRHLSERRLYRSLHNLVAVMETVEMSQRRDPQTIASLIAWKSPRYYKLFEDIYLGQ
jgi:queuine/archaeosine tRNA-ribosyltransferase